MTDRSTGLSSDGPPSDVEARPARGSRDPPIELIASSARRALSEQTSNTGPSRRRRWFCFWYSREMENQSHFEFRVRQVDSHAIGYPRIAAFMASDPNFLIYRRFGYIRQRVLLHMERELCDLEHRLNVFDRSDVKTNPKLLRDSQLDDDQVHPRRKLLLQEMDAKLKDYDDLLFRTEKVVQQRAPTLRNLKSLLSAIQRTHSFNRDEYRFLFEKEDLMSLADHLEDSWVNGIVEDALIKMSPKLSKFIFQTKEQREIAASDAPLHLYSKRRIDVFVMLLYSLFATICIIVPVLVLFSEHLTNGQKLAIVVVCTLVFAVSIPLLTGALRHEVLTATATYCAVIVVFVANAQTVVSTVTTTQALARRWLPS